MKKAFIFCIVASCFLLKASAQDLLGDLMKEDSGKVKQNITTATFKSTRIINGQSVEMTCKGNLQFMISHHFGNVWNKGKGWQNVTQLFGLNSGVATTYLSFDYSYTDWLYGFRWQVLTLQTALAPTTWHGIVFPFCIKY